MEPLPLSAVDNLIFIGMLAGMTNFLGIFADLRQHDFS